MALRKSKGVGITLRLAGLGHSAGCGCNASSTSWALETSTPSSIALKKRRHLLVASSGVGHSLPVLILYAGQKQPARRAFLRRRASRAFDCSKGNSHHWLGCRQPSFSVYWTLSALARETKVHALRKPKRKPKIASAKCASRSHAEEPAGGLWAPLARNLSRRQKVPQQGVPVNIGLKPGLTYVVASRPASEGPKQRRKGRGALGSSEAGEKVFWKCLLQVGSHFSNMGGARMSARMVSAHLSRHGQAALC